YDEMTFQAEPGDVIVLYSDGVSDHVSVGGEEYGRAGLAQILRGCRGCSPKAIVQEIFADLDRFNTDRFDDQTLIVMRVQ
ncbi:MAG TPA: SpoIIE family protein phosphatase, partial [Bryobacteraceae bacterium]|nr:SpoIIE family protein phosphatase [Bryobacteraceae bacterium]